jgi:LPXTG-motif cell wall-anchored protein
MFKKFFCLALALVMMMSVAAVGFSAAQVEIAEAGADADAATTGADADAATTGADAEVASTGLDTSKCLNFDVSTTGWNNFEAVGFYICNVDGTEWKPWGNKSLFKSEETSSGIWSFDPDANGVGLKDGEQYYVIFVNKLAGTQTANLLFDTSCLGDTAYCDGSTQENDVDSNKSSLVARWRNSSLGPMKVVTSIGNVVGETIPKNTNAYDMLVNFLKNTLNNAREYSKKDDQKLLDDVAEALGLSKDDVTKAISDSAVSGIEWSADKSSLKSGSSSNSGSDSSSGSGSDSSSGSGSGSSSGSGSGSSSTKSGSASNTQTGQTEDILFIMLGVMVVAAGVIFFARKRERA